VTSVGDNIWRKHCYWVSFKTILLQTCYGKCNFFDLLSVQTRMLRQDDAF